MNTLITYAPFSTETIDLAGNKVSWDCSIQTLIEYPKSRDGGSKQNENYHRFSRKHPTIDRR